MYEKTSPLQLKENRQHSSTLVPFSVYQCQIPEINPSVPMHWHREFEINQILKGQGQMILGEEKYIVSEGDIVIAPPNVLHAAYAIEGSSFAYDALVFNHSILGTGSNDRSISQYIRPIIAGQRKIMMWITAVNERYLEFKKCIDVIFTCAKDNKPLSDLLLKSELLRFFWLLENQEPELVQRDEVNIHYSELIRPALEYMAEHYAETITVEELADTVHLSKSYFMWCFKHATGIGAIEHLTQIRMKSVCEALMNTDQHVAEVAGSCGYDNLSNFNRQFKRMIGCTPIEYRKRNR